MRVEDNHAHATTRYKPISKEDYPLLVNDILELIENEYASLTVHLPFQVQHPSVYPDLEAGIRFINYGEHLKKFFGIKLYWENAPEEEYGHWHLKHGQTTWTHVPHNIDLCLDLGHLMIGTSDTTAAIERIDQIIANRGSQIKHLHIHENDLLHDQHRSIGTILSQEYIDSLIKNRSYIFEKGE